MDLGPRGGARRRRRDGGGGWGDGKLHYEDKTHAFPVMGLSVVDVGGGMSAVVLRNQNGVVVELTSTQTGVKFTLAGEGIEVELK